MIMLENMIKYSRNILFHCRLGIKFRKMTWNKIELSILKYCYDEQITTQPKILDDINN